MAALHRLAVQGVLSSRSADAAMRLALKVLLAALGPRENFLKFFRDNGING
jgi:hypothetical protein